MPNRHGNMGSPGPHHARGVVISVADSSSVVRYACSRCDQSSLTIWYMQRTQLAKLEGEALPVGIAGIVLTKLGQLPAPETRPDPMVEKALSSAGRDFYKKGLRSLAHGFGVGALAYFRRVVEDATTEILTIVEEVAESEGDAATVERIQEAMAAKEMEEKLRLAAQALPASLRPGNVNPLRVLFQQYSKGLHDRTEHECSQIAERMRFTLEYLFKNWKAQLEESERFRKEVGVWSDPQAEPRVE